MKYILTVLGKDKSGIIAKVATMLAERNVNIEDVSQTIMQGNFTMIMLCDLNNSTLPLKDLSALLKEEGEKWGVSIHVQHEDIFNAMHRV